MRTPRQDALAVLELSCLGDDADEDAVCEARIRAAGDWGHLAAVCVPPRLVAAARAEKASGVRVVAALSYPDRDGDAHDAIEETKMALGEGADDIDVVIPYQDFLEGQEAAIEARIRRVRDAAGTLPVRAILETGALGDVERARRAAELALEAGADWLVTASVFAVGAPTRAAARAVVEAIAAAGAEAGIKFGGPIRDRDDIDAQFDLAEEILGAPWTTPARLRLAGDRVLDLLIEGE